MIKLALNLVWLAVVFVGLAIVVLRFDEYGVWGIAAIVVGVAMLAVYAMSFFAKSGAHAELASLVSDYAAAVLILGAIAVLVISLVAGLRSSALGVNLILLLFIWIFVGIFRDYLKHLKGRKRKRKMR